MPPVFFTFSRVLRRTGRLDLTDKSPPDPLQTPLPSLNSLLVGVVVVVVTRGDTDPALREDEEQV
eukprot:6976892-Pyramimonas_sp.AAC.1